jgi:hypothetical protein
MSIDDREARAKELLAQCGPDAADHPIVWDGEIVRFKADPVIKWCALKVSLNALALYAERADSPEMRLAVRRFYRNMGYSLCGYLDIFGDQLDAEENERP